MTVVADDVLAVAPEFIDVDTDTIDRMIAMAELEVSRTAWGRRADNGVAFLAAHFLKLRALAEDDTAGETVGRGPVISETVGPVSRSYASPSAPAPGEEWYAATLYGRTYLQLRKSIFAARMT